MTRLSDTLADILLRKDLKDYFKMIEESVDDNSDLDTLTKFFTDKPYTETKPYFTRRKLIPKDERFKDIEIVYDEKKDVKAITWEIIINLNQLIQIFGEPVIHNEPYSASTAFAFKSRNPKIEIIKTRYPEWLSENKNNREFDYNNDKGESGKILNPEFEFVQFNIK